jgi:lysophospholipase L1-like esterase
MAVKSPVPYIVEPPGNVRWTYRGQPIPPALETKPGRAALAYRDNAPLKIAVCGTSVSEGTGPAGPFTNRWIYRFQTWLRGAFPTANVKGGVGYLPAFFEGGQPDAPNVVDLSANLGGASTASKYGTSGLGGRAYALSRGAALVYTQECTSFKVFFSRDQFSVNASVSIDGGTATTVTGLSNASLVGGFTWTSPALDPGVHTVRIATTDAAGFYSKVEGVHFYYRDETKGIWVIDATKNGATAYLPTMDTVPLQSLAVYAPDIVIAEYLTNDYLYGPAAYGATSYYTNLINWVNKLITAQGSKRFTLMFMINPETSATPVASHGQSYSMFAQVIKDVAASYANHATCRPIVIDWRDYMGPTVGGDLEGLWFDPAHLSLKGNAFVADLMAQALGMIGGGRVEPDLGVIRVPAEAGTVTSAPTGELALFARNIAGRIVPRFVDPDGLDTTIQPHIGERAVAQLSPGSGTAVGTIMEAMGTSYTAVVTGTAAAVATPTPASTNYLTSLRRSQFVTGTTATGIASIRQNVREAWRGNAASRGGFHFMCRIGHETRVPERTFVGLQEGEAAPTNVDPLTTTALSKVGLAHAASTGNWRLIHNAAGTAPTTIDLGASFAVDLTSVIEVHLFCEPNASVIFYRVVNRSTGAVASSSLAANLPVATTFMAMMAWAGNTTAATATLSVIKMYLESDL